MPEELSLSVIIFRNTSRVLDPPHLSLIRFLASTGLDSSSIVFSCRICFCKNQMRKVWVFVCIWSWDIFNQLVSALWSSPLSDDCLLAPPAEWSEWSVCLRDGVTCGFRWGKRTRTRGGSRTSEEKAALLCPSHSETERCRMRKKCPTGEEGDGGGRKEVRGVTGRGDWTTEPI